MEKLDRIRVATLQYCIRPIASFEEFEQQVSGLIETASDYKCRLLVFPEYFAVQLLSLESHKRPMKDLVRDLAKQAPRIIEMMRKLAVKHNIYVVAGSVPLENKITGEVRNASHLLSPSGEVGVQEKLHMTRFEDEDWIVRAGQGLKVFDTSFGKLAIAICYDVEFPELVRAAARAGAQLLVVPSCTDERQGFLRVRYCAQARAIENQMYVLHSSTVGSLPSFPAISLNYGQASILTPSDFAFSRDGILAEGTPNVETMVMGELNLRLISESRSNGTVLPLLDSAKTAQLISEVELIRL